MKSAMTRLTAALLVGLVACSARAAVISTAANGGTGAFSVSSTDLANSNQATFSSASLTAGTANFGSSVPALFEGTMYADAGAGNTEGLRSLTPSNGAVLVLSLNTALNPTGYDIQSINTYTGTAQSRSGQAYDVAISNVAAPNTFIPLYSVTSALANNVDGGTGEVRVSTVQNAGNLLLGTGVAKIQFTFQDCCASATVDNSMFREIDVLGSVTGAPVPTFSQAALTGTNQILPAGNGFNLAAALNFIYPGAQGGVAAPGTVNGIPFQNIAWDNGAAQALTAGGSVTITPVLGARQRFQVTGSTISGPDEAVLESIANTINFLGANEQVSTNLAGLPANTPVRVQVIGGDAGTGLNNWLGDLEVIVNGLVVGNWTVIADDNQNTASLATFTATTNGSGQLNMTFRQINQPPGQFAGIAGLVVMTNVNTIPEPASLSMLGLGALALLRRRRLA